MKNAYKSSTDTIFKFQTEILKWDPKFLFVLKMFSLAGSPQNLI